MTDPTPFTPPASDRFHCVVDVRGERKTTTVSVPRNPLRAQRQQRTEAIRLAACRFNVSTRKVVSTVQVNGGPQIGRRA